MTAIVPACLSCHLSSEFNKEVWEIENLLIQDTQT